MPDPTLPTADADAFRRWLLCHRSTTEQRPRRGEVLRRGLVRTEPAGKHSTRVFARLPEAVEELTTAEALRHFRESAPGGVPGWLP